MQLRSGRRWADGAGVGRGAGDDRACALADPGRHAVHAQQDGAHRPRSEGRGRRAQHAGQHHSEDRPAHAALRGQGWRAAGAPRARRPHLPLALAERSVGAAVAHAAHLLRVPGERVGGRGRGRGQRGGDWPAPTARRRQPQEAPRAPPAGRRRGPQLRGRGPVGAAAQGGRRGARGAGLPAGATRRRRQRQELPRVDSSAHRRLPRPQRQMRAAPAAVRGRGRLQEQARAHAAALRVGERQRGGGARAAAGRGVAPRTGRAAAHAARPRRLRLRAPPAPLRRPPRPLRLTTLQTVLPKRAIRKSDKQSLHVPIAASWTSSAAAPRIHTTAAIAIYVFEPFD